MSEVNPSTEKPATCVDDVRRVREQLSDQFDNNVYKLGEYIRQVGEEYRQQLSLKIPRTGLVANKTQPK